MIQQRLDVPMWSQIKGKERPSEPIGEQKGKRRTSVVGKKGQNLKERCPERNRRLSILSMMFRYRTDQKCSLNS
jgi:hypothetical protein